MKNKRVLYTILFCIWIGINYFGIWADATKQMADNLSGRNTPIFLSAFQSWFLRILSQIFDSVFIAIATGIFAYHYRELKTWQYVALALFVRYFTLVLFLPFALWKHSLSDILESTREFAPTYEVVIMALVQFSLAIVGALLGISYGRNSPYLDEKDEAFGFIGGISKRICALLIILFNPVARFVTELSLTFMYKFSKDVSSGEYWKATLSNFFSMDESAPGGIFDLIYNFLLVWFFWAITAFTFYFGVQTVRDKEAKYRLLKIMAIYVALPAAIVVIPIIRNRTWFF